MAIKIEEGKTYKITDGNGGVRQAKVIDRTTKPPRVAYVTRGASGRGTFTKTPISVTLPAFRKLLVEDSPATL